MKQEVVRFKSIELNSAFSPASGEVGSQFVYIKRVNGICPKVGRGKEEGIFYPEDKVVRIRLPLEILKRYQ